MVRNTVQRQVILEELRKHNTHPTAAALYEVVRGRLPRISLGTVYRNLELLARAGEIKRIKTSGSPTRFDGDLSDHYHVRCESCGRLGDIMPAADKTLGGSPDAIDGWEIRGHRLEYSGLCPDCR